MHSCETGSPKPLAHPKPYTHPNPSPPPNPTLTQTPRPPQTLHSPKPLAHPKPYTHPNPSPTPNPMLTRITCLPTFAIRLLSPSMKLSPCLGSYSARILLRTDPALHIEPLHESSSFTSVHRSSCMISFCTDPGNDGANKHFRRMSNGSAAWLALLPKRRCASAGRNERLSRLSWCVWYMHLPIPPPPPSSACGICSPPHPITSPQAPPLPTDVPSSPTAVLSSTRAPQVSTGQPGMLAQWGSMPHREPSLPASHQRVRGCPGLVSVGSW